MSQKTGVYKLNETKRDKTDNNFTDNIIISKTGNNSVQLTNFPNNTVLLSTQGNTEILGTLGLNVLNGNAINLLASGSAVKLVSVPPGIDGSNMALNIQKFFDGTDAGIRAGQFQISDSQLATGNRMTIYYSSAVGNTTHIAVGNQAFTATEYLAFLSDLPQINYSSLSFDATAWSTYYTSDILPNIVAQKIIQLNPQNNNDTFTIQTTSLDTHKKVRVFNIAGAHKAVIIVNGVNYDCNAGTGITIIKTPVGYWSYASL
jgi:hypothetical protein